ncbi:hypothetical protein [Aquimarina brevivitae]|uniref:Uncharacterized protein n=1 Tax=Aquimarina brevivitae TaxID=323412 RepID=A0A4Q7PIG7_9FLAO|nr:hypothetical protein [Aquimarina brevivitae]RZT00236.1 hypothetical protein EV197_1472 [Aquimarina brevivitae]
MKIEFEIDEKESVLLLDIIKQFMGQTSDPQALKALSKIATEIEADMAMGDEIFKRLRYRLTPYTNGNRITPAAAMKLDLGISQNFLTRLGGLEREVNSLLKNIVQKYKPDYDLRTLHHIPLSAIKKCKRITDVVTLIQSSYESL